jgi:hypothetical protein
VQWLAENRSVLTLTSAEDCGVDFFAGQGDGSLPVRAQSAPFADGLQLTPIEGSTWGPAHGDRYGGFCHSAIDTETTEGHALAVETARDRILDWLFTSAPFVVAEGTIETESELAQGESTAPLEIGTANCPSGTQDVEVLVEGVRRHPGLFDGDDTPIDANEIDVELTSGCQAQFVWTQNGSDGDHAARFHWKVSVQTETGVLARSVLP